MGYLLLQRRSSHHINTDCRHSSPCPIRIVLDLLLRGQRLRHLMVLHFCQWREGQHLHKDSGSHKHTACELLGLNVDIVLCGQWHCHIMASVLFVRSEIHNRINHNDSRPSHKQHNYAPIRNINLILDVVLCSQRNRDLLVQIYCRRCSLHQGNSDPCSRLRPSHILGAVIDQNSFF